MEQFAVEWSSLSSNAAVCSRMEQVALVLFEHPVLIVRVRPRRDVSFFLKNIRFFLLEKLCFKNAKNGH